jgi:hypothetical protein
MHVNILVYFSFFCCANLIFHFVQELYHLSMGVSEDDALLVFNNSAQKVIKDTIKHAGYQLITYYYKCVMRQSMNIKIGLEQTGIEQYLLGKVDWLPKLGIPCASGGHPPCSGSGLIGLEQTGRESVWVGGCTTMTQMDTSEKFRERYDTQTPVLQLLCINFCIILDSLLQKASTVVEPH